MTDNRRVMMNNAEHELEVIEYLPGRKGGPAGLKARIDGKEFYAEVHTVNDNCLRIVLGDKTELIRFVKAGRNYWIFNGGNQALIETLAGRPASFGPAGDVTPPMPAVVARLLVERGQHVERGQAMVVVSAMKMETTLAAPRDGVVTAVNIAEGDKVSPGQILIEVEPGGEDHDGNG
ncbi:MAG: biotin/lipoyl-binding protein [Deltaproteobacteria bacterium]|nr:biotin/lipoyl-binding protein [Deltaproteobacteria bacterium]